MIMQELMEGGSSHAFDGDLQTCWYTVNIASAYVGYNFYETVHLYKVVLKKGSEGVNMHVRSGYIQYSDDGTNWSNANEETFETTEDNSDSIFTVNAGAHRYWRITCESNRWAYWDQVAVGELELYGRIFEP